MEGRKVGKIYRFDQCVKEERAERMHSVVEEEELSAEGTQKALR